MRLVIDASVAVKWLLVEDRHELARDVLEDGFELIAPDLLLVEVANALRNKFRAGLVAKAQADSAIEALPGYFDSFFRPSDVLANAFDIACGINHPVADCIYLACAIETGAPLLTDDAALFAKSKTLSGVKIILLRDWPPREAAP